MIMHGVPANISCREPLISKDTILQYSAYVVTKRRILNIIIVLINVSIVALVSFNLFFALLFAAERLLGPLRTCVRQFLTVFNVFPIRYLSWVR